MTAPAHPSIVEAAFGAFVPRPRLTLSEWADRYRVIAPGTSPEPGPWRTSRTPYLREPMDAISDPTVERVVCMWASQVGKTDGMLLNTIGYFAAQDPSPILLVQPTEMAAAAFSKERIEPTFRATPALAGKLSDSLRDKDNTIHLKQFPGGYLAMAWATSATSLASRPIRVLLGDEIDRWPVSTGKDGDPWKQARQRTSNFHNRKIIAVSTPLLQGSSRIAALYEDTDQRRLWVPCPRCGVDQVLRWERVIYKNAAGDVDLEDVHYRCEHCDGRIEERDRPAMLDACTWRPEYPERRHRGYQLSALYSPWVKWRELAEEWIKAIGDRDRTGLQEFVNLRLGEEWDDSGKSVGAADLEKNREDYEAEAPAGVLMLVCGTDVQHNRLEVEILGWGLGRESWGIHYAIIPGDTSTAGPWQALDAFLQRTWKRADGSVLPLTCTCIDAGDGGRTDEVYEFCRPRVARNIFPVKGREGVAVPIANKPTLNPLRAPLYIVGVDNAKDALASRLALQRDPATGASGPGFCHFPVDKTRGYDTQYFRGLLSEKKKWKVRAGRKVPFWVAHEKRNEPLDCRNYATAAMEIMLLNHPRLLEQLAEVEAARVKGTPPSPPRQPPGRRVLSRGIE